MQVNKIDCSSVNKIVQEISIVSEQDVSVSFDEVPEQSESVSIGDVYDQDVSFTFGEEIKELPQAIEEKNTNKLNLKLDLSRLDVMPEMRGVPRTEFFFSINPIRNQRQQILYENFFEKICDLYFTDAECIGFDGRPIPIGSFLLFDKSQDYAFKMQRIGRIVEAHLSKKAENGKFTHSFVTSKQFLMEMGINHEYEFLFKDSQRFYFEEIMEVLQCLQIQPKRLIKGFKLKLLRDIDIAEKMAWERHYLEFGQREYVLAQEFDLAAYWQNEWNDNFEFVPLEEVIPQEQEPCIFCGQRQELHTEVFSCRVCYMELEISQKAITCSPSCTEICRECFCDNQIAQLPKYRSTHKFYCSCDGRSEIDYEIVVKQMTEEGRKKVENIDLTIKVDSDPNMIWCPNIECQKEIRKEGESTKLTCSHCGQMACFKCHHKREEGHKCKSSQQAGYKFYLCLNDVRPCPKCGVKIEKNRGCPHMKCEWCKFDFCWSCMAEEEKCLSRVCCLPLCPRLPFNMCVNFSITLLAIVLAPLLLPILPFVAAIVCSVYVLPLKIISRAHGGRYICKNRRMTGKQKWQIPLIVVLSTVFLTPISLALAAPVACLTGSIGLMLFWMLCLIYMVITTKNWIKLLSL